MNVINHHIIKNITTLYRETRSKLIPFKGFVVSFIKIQKICKNAFRPLMNNGEGLLNIFQHYYILA